MKPCRALQYWLSLLSAKHAAPQLADLDRVTRVMFSHAQTALQSFLLTPQQQNHLPSSGLETHSYFLCYLTVQLSLLLVVVLTLS